MQRLTVKVIKCPNCGHENRFELEYEDEHTPKTNIVNCAGKSKGGCTSKFIVDVAVHIETKTYSLMPFEVN